MLYRGKNEGQHSKRADTSATSITIEEVAKLAGTSRATVSRVINDAPNVSSELRARVERVITELGYRPNSSARGLASKSTHILSLVLSRSQLEVFDDPFYSPLIKGLAAACSTEGYNLMLMVIDSFEPQVLSRLLNSHNADGFILAISLVANSSFIPYLTQRGTPFVSIGRHPFYSGINFVDTNNLAAAREAVNYMLGQGLRRIATITGNLQVTSSIDRRDGYQQALYEAGITPDHALIIEGGFSSQQGYEAMRRLLPHKPDGVFVANDTMAVGAYRAIYEAGLRIPEDIAVVGFDDNEHAAHLTPTLTTVHQPITELGMVAAEAVAKLIKGELSQPVQQILPAKLIIRESCRLINPASLPTLAHGAARQVDSTCWLRG